MRTPEQERSIKEVQRHFTSDTVWAWIEHAAGGDVEMATPGYRFVFHQTGEYDATIPA